MANKVVVSMYNSLIYGIQYRRGPAYSHYEDYIPKRRWIRARGNVSLPPIAPPAGSNWHDPL